MEEKCFGRVLIANKNRNFATKIQEAMEKFNWAEDIDGAITVSDAEGNVIYMNKRSRETFGGKDGRSMVGQSMMPCHNERSQAIIRHMLESGESHCYTITKKGRRKLIFQTPWKEDGEVRGLVEFSFVLPDEMPHYNRD